MIRSLKSLTQSVIALTVAVLCLSSQVAFAETYYERGREYLAAKQYKIAADCFGRALQENPGNGNALYYLAVTCAQAGLIEQAKAYYKLVVAEFPTTRAASYSLTALKSLRSYTKPSPNVASEPSSITASAALASAKAFLNQDKTPIVNSNQSVDDLLKKGAALQENGRGPEAERDYLDALREAEKFGQNSVKIADASQALGDYYAENGSYEHACDYYRRELQIRQLAYGKDSHELADCMMRQEQTFINAGDYEDAEDLLRRSMDIYQHEYDTADRDHKRTVQQKKSLTAAMINLAQLLYKERRSSDAKALEAQLRRMAE